MQSKSKNNEATQKLLDAANNGTLKELRQCLSDQAVDVNAVNASGLSALMCAARRGVKGAVVLLLKHGANGAYTTDHGVNALMLASWAGKSECVQVLLEHCDVRAVDERQINALMLAVQSKDEKCVRALVPHSDLMAQDRDGDNVLMWAAKRQNIKMLSVILEYIPVSTLREQGDQNGISVWDWAQRGGAERELLLYLEQRLEAFDQQCALERALGEGANEGQQGREPGRKIKIGL